MNSVLVTEMRESTGYLQDAGWQQTARLMALAANEIERLKAEIHALEAQFARSAPPVVAMPRRDSWDRGT